MKYLQSMHDLPLTLDADSLNRIQWWVDASFAVYPDMKSHTGGMMMIGKGTIYASLMEQKLNTWSLTEAEIVGVNDLMPQVLWTRYFIEAQGYKVSDNIVYQDNESAMQFEKNGKKSSSKCTRHIDIHYFFVTNRIQSGDLMIEYCPTGMMLGDFYTKALQGKAFRMFRDQILNLKSLLIQAITLFMGKLLSNVRKSTSSGMTSQECCSMCIDTIRHQTF
eukprot:1643793-Ditylum_brightwellii.AAC.3